MQWNVPPDLEQLILKRVASGIYADADEVLRCALEAQHNGGESWTSQQRLTISSHIEEGYLQAERGELFDATQAQENIEAMKAKWRVNRQCGRRDIKRILSERRESSV